MAPESNSKDRRGKRKDQSIGNRNSSKTQHKNNVLVGNQKIVSNHNNKSQNSMKADVKKPTELSNPLNTIQASNQESFVKKAKELKDNIIEALDKQSKINSDQANGDREQVDELREDIRQITKSLEIDKDIENGECETKKVQNPGDLNESPTDQVKSEGVDEVGSNEVNAEQVDTDRVGKDQKKDVIVVTGDKNGQTESDNNEENGFEPLRAKLDTASKYAAFMLSLKKHFQGEVPHIVEPICRKLVDISEENDGLRLENSKLNSVREKLEGLCRELQKSNNAIRIESFDLIKEEQSKAKEQANKIQSTLSGVMKLFDENQQRNVNLRQENHDLQTKLRALLDHCDNWEKSTETALKQRDIENRLIRTELAKANLVRSEESERHLKEKQDLLQLLSMMKEQQHRIETQEAKLRADLSNYASKYDECQDIISKGMSKFQQQSKRMLKEIERSKQDYKVLLAKYESSTKRMAQLLEERQTWSESMSKARKKIEALEKLCRALRNEQNTVSVSRPTSDTENKPIVSKVNENLDDSREGVLAEAEKSDDCNELIEMKGGTENSNGNETIELTSLIK